MFGLSFYFILDGGLKRGEDVRRKFIWRLGLLALFGYLHGVLYSSDILLVLAILGVPLVLLWKVRTKILVGFAVILLFEPAKLWCVYEVLNNHLPSAAQLHEVLFARLIELYRHGSLEQVVIANGSWGQLPRLLFNVESGRLWQMLGLFICGLLVGRSKFLESMNGIEFVAKRVF